MFSDHYRLYAVVTVQAACYFFFEGLFLSGINEIITMKIASLANVAAVNDQQIQTATDKILIEATGSAAEIDSATVSLRLVSRTSGNRVLIDRMPLTALFEFSAHKEGFYHDSEAAGVRAVKGTIPVGFLGALDLGDGYLSLGINASGPLETLDIYAMEHPILGNVSYVYSPIIIQGGVTKEINLIGVDTLLFPEDKVSILDIDFPTRSVSYDRKELQALARAANDLVSTGAATVAGFGKFIVLNVQAATRFSITPVANDNFTLYLIDSK